MQVMNKRVIVSLPAELYDGIKRLATREYRSVSSLIRESILEKMEEEFTVEEISLIDKARKSFHAGKGTNWREVKRG